MYWKKKKQKRVHFTSVRFKKKSIAHSKKRGTNQQKEIRKRVLNWILKKKKKKN